MQTLLPYPHPPPPICQRHCTGNQISLYNRYTIGRWYQQTSFGIFIKIITEAQVCQHFCFTREKFTTPFIQINVPVPVENVCHLLLGKLLESKTHQTFDSADCSISNYRENCLKDRINSKYIACVHALQKCAIRVHTCRGLSFRFVT